MPPNDSVATIARMAEIERACHFWNVAAHEGGISTETIAGDPFGHAIAAGALHSKNAVIRINRKPHCGAARDNDDFICFGGTAQSVDQLPASAAGESQNAHRRMPRIVDMCRT